MNIGLIGRGAIAQYVMAHLRARGQNVSALLVRRAESPLEFAAVDALPHDIDVMIDCAGHEALMAYGADILARGCDLIILSVGALANAALADTLTAAAAQGKARLHLASGAIGGLDCLRAARIGGLDEVLYTGRKPPQGWRGSAAETTLDLNNLDGEHTHFTGSARQAALAYPKNANVAAAVALAGLGFDATKVRLIADTAVAHNIHEITARGQFGTFHFQIAGDALPDNPRSSALAAMSVISCLDQITAMDGGGVAW